MLNAVPAELFEVHPRLLTALGWVEVFRHHYERGVAIVRCLVVIPEAVEIDGFRVLESLALVTSDDVFFAERLPENERC